MTYDEVMSYYVQAQDSLTDEDFRYYIGLYYQAWMNGISKIKNNCITN